MHRQQPRPRGRFYNPAPRFSGSRYGRNQSQSQPHHDQRAVLERPTARTNWDQQSYSPSYNTQHSDIGFENPIPQQPSPLQFAGSTQYQFWQEQPTASPHSHHLYNQNSNGGIPRFQGSQGSSFHYDQVFQPNFGIAGNLPAGPIAEQYHGGFSFLPRDPVSPDFEHRGDNQIGFDSRNHTHFHFENWQNHEEIDYGTSAVPPHVQLPYSDEYRDFAVPHPSARPIQDTNRNRVEPMNRVSRQFKQGRPSKFRKPSWKPPHAGLNAALDGSDEQYEYKPLSRPTETVPRPIHAPETPTTLFHYTSLADHALILKDKCLRARDHSKGFGSAGKASRFGNGIYFTDISPHETTEDILKNNYGIVKIHLNQAVRTEVCYEFLSEFIPRLVFCEDQTCLGPQNERRRKIWMTDLSELPFHEKNGFYYIRELAGFGVAKSVIKKPWN